MKEINLGKTISELRAAKGVTQDDVAAALSVSNKALWQEINIPIQYKRT